MNEAPAFARRQQNGIIVDGCSAHDEPRHGVQRIMLNDAENAPGLQNTAHFFGESQSRFVVSFPREALVQLHDLSSRRQVPFAGIGSVGGERLVVTGAIDVPLSDLRKAYEGALDAPA